MVLNLTRSLFSLLTIFVMAAFLTKTVPAYDDPVADRATDPAEEPAEEPAEVDPFAVPEGDIDALVDFIERVHAYQPTSREEYQELMSRGLPALEQAANAILEQEPDTESDAYRIAHAEILQQKAMNFLQLDSDAQVELVAEVIAFCTDVELCDDHIRTAVFLSRGLEQTGNEELITESFTTLSELIATSDNSDYQQFARSLAGKLRRANMVGNEMVLTGKKMDGEEIDWESYRGKVVLVDFWATWCGPCVAEYPNILQNYDTYHEHGFEVIGISLDNNREALERYIDEKEVPWVNLFQEGGGAESADYYGISSIPTMILVDREGVVVTTSARGSELTRWLGEMIDLPEEADESDSDESTDNAVEERG